MSIDQFLCDFSYEKPGISVLQPSGEPKFYMVATALNSVFYFIPKCSAQRQWPFLQELRKVFPKDRGLGLITKEVSSHYIFEVVLSTNEDCDFALNTPISFEHGSRKFSCSAVTAIHPSLELRVGLSQLPIMHSDTSKNLLLERLSKRCTVLDIVLYQEGFTSSWFMGNGYMHISRKKNQYSHAK